MSKAEIECVIASDTLEQQLRKFGKLPKCLKVVVKKSKHSDRHVSNYAVVRVITGDLSVTVPYEVLRKLSEKLKGQQVTLKASSEGLHLVYSGGNVFLKNLGEWEDAVELKISA